MKRLLPIFLFFSLLLSACVAPAPPRSASGGKAQWNHAADALIVQVTAPSGFLPSELYQEVYIPETQIWGDGRITWGTYVDGEGYTLRTGRLTSEQMTLLLQRFAHVGFLLWRSHYQNGVAIDGAPRCISVELAMPTVQHQVCELAGGAPQAFYTLFDFLVSGAGATGVPYTPTTAYIRTWPADTAVPFSQSPISWPTDLFGLPASAALDGVWVQGEGLAHLWQAVLDDHYPVLTVADEHGIYALTMQIPGLNWGGHPTPKP